MKNSLLIIIWIISVIIFVLGGLLNLYYFLLTNVDFYSFSLYAVISILLIVLLSFVFFKIKWSLFIFELFFLVFLYPFSLLFMLLYLAYNKRESEMADPFYMGNFSSRKRGVSKFVKERFDTVSLKFLMVNTEDSNIKKKSVLNLKYRILDSTENKQIKEHVKLLKLARSDSHPDVALYASDSITEIEEYFEDKIAGLHAGLPKTAKAYADKVLTYLDSDIPKGAIARFFARDAVKHLQESVGESYSEKDYFVEGASIFSKAGMMQEQTDLLNEGFEKTGDLAILKKLGLIEYALGNVKKASRLHREYRTMGGDSWFASGTDS